MEIRRLLEKWVASGFLYRKGYWEWDHADGCNPNTMKKGASWAVCWKEEWQRWSDSGEAFVMRFVLVSATERIVWAEGEFLRMADNTHTNRVENVACHNPAIASVSSFILLFYPIYKFYNFYCYQWNYFRSCGVDVCLQCCRTLDQWKTQKQKMRVWTGKEKRFTMSVK